MRVTRLGGGEAFELANFPRPPSMLEFSPTQECWLGPPAYNLQWPASYLDLPHGRAYRLGRDFSVVRQSAEAKVPFDDFFGLPDLCDKMLRFVCRPQDDLWPQAGS